MKTSDFEENFTAWLDGRLTGDALAALEKELLARGFDPAAERSAAGPLAGLLRKHSAPPTLNNPDFFNHQILHRIAQEQPAAPAPAPRRAWWTLPRLAWAGAWCLLLALFLFQTLIPHGAPRDKSPYFAQVIDARSLADGVSADTVYTARDNVTVVWLGGLDYLPADYKLQ